MRETKLILIEGLPGSGKSTLAHLLLRRICGQGIDAHWWYEEEKDHPLYVFGDEASLRQVVDEIFSGDHAEVVTAALAEWRAFSERLQSSGTVALLDSCLFGYLTWTLFPADVPTEEIGAYVAEVERIIAPLKPTLIYLFQHDVAAALRRICDRRGGETEQRLIERATGCPYGQRHRLAGFDGMVAFWSAYRAFTDRCFAAVPFAKLAIETGGGDWTAYERRALDFSDLPAAADRRPAAVDLQRFTGIYTRVEGDEPRSCAIVLEGGTLFLDGLPGFWPKNRLILKAPGIFDVDSFPFEIRFEADAAGTIRGMRLDGPVLLGGGASAAFAKTASSPSAAPD